MVSTVNEKADLEVNESKSSHSAFIGACGALFAGAVLGVASLALWISEVLEGRSFRWMEIVLPTSAFLLFATGAHLLDRVDARKRQNYK